ncbi:MAG: hypothetical protein R2771_00480 [Saprospiraceae bacterium]
MDYLLHHVIVLLQIINLNLYCILEFTMLLCHTYTIFDGANSNTKLFGVVTDANEEIPIYGLYSNNHVYTINIVDSDNNSIDKNVTILNIEQAALDSISIVNPAYNRDDGSITLNVTDVFSHPDYK